MQHKQTVLDLPDTGLILVEGENGAGKSSLLECASFAAHNKTLRGTSPWPKNNGNGAASIITDKFEITRLKVGAKISLVWNPHGTAPVEFETATKAQEALTAVNGAFDTWRRSHVFSSQDASHFTLATDAERKRLIETILGLSIFDEALQECRRHLKAAETMLAGDKGEAMRLRVKLEAETKRKEEAEATLTLLGPAPDEEKLETQEQSLIEAQRGINLERKELLEEKDSLAAANDQLQHNLALAKKHYERVQTSQCPNCGQSISDAWAAAVKAEVAKAEREAKTASDKSREQLEEVTAAIRELTGQAVQITEKLATIRATLKAAQQAKNLREAQETILTDASETIDKINEALDNLIKTQADSEQLVTILGIAEQVLGLRGVRAHILGKALVGIEVIANIWLSRIAGQDFRLSLKPYKENKSGDTTDAISLEVEGAGDGYGYRASSGGERRRIDIALLLALGEVSAAAQGTQFGSCFMDDVFDALDTEGIAAVGEVLREISLERCVVVMSPLRQDVREALHPDRIVTVENGEIKC